MDFVTTSWGEWALRASEASVVALFLRLAVIGILAHGAVALLRRAPAALRHLVATVALAAMLVVTVAAALGPAWPAFVVPVRGIAPASRAESASTFRAPRPERMTGTRISHRAEVAEPGARPAAAPEILPVPGSDPAGAAGREWPALPGRMLPEWPPSAASWAWAALLAVAATVAAVRLIGWLVIARIAAAGAEVSDPRILGLLELARKRLGLTGGIVLRSTSRVSVPMVMGFAVPRLVLPSAALEWNDERLLAVFLHELAHVRRGDAIALLISRAATVAAWFHPLAWSLARTARRDCERACDDMVLSAGVRPSTYADELLAIARDAAMLGTRPAGALAVARPSNLEGRLLAILSANTRRGPASRGAVLGAAAAAMALLAPLTSVRVVAAPETRPPLANAIETTAAGWKAGKFEKASLASLDPESAVSATDPAETTWKSDPARVDSRGQVDPEGTSDFADKTARYAYAQELAQYSSRSGNEWFSVAKKRYDDHEFDAAGEFYERAARAGYRPGTAWYNAACSFALDGQTNRSLGALHSAIDEGFDSYDLIQSDEDLNSIRSDRRYRMLIQRVMDTDEVTSKRSSARARYQALKSRQDPDSEALKSTGMQLMRSGDPALAAEAFARQYAADSSSSSLYNQACAEALAGQPGKALATLERSIYVGAGNADHMMEDPDLASIRGTTEFARLVELADDLALNMGNFESIFRLRRPEEVARYERVAREHPGVGRAWFNLGFAQLRTGEAEDSRRSFLRALGLGYRRGTTSYNIACSAARAGDTEEALRWLVRAEEAGMQIHNLARWDDDLKPLRGNVRFQRMLERLEREERDEKNHGKDKHDEDYEGKVYEKYKEKEKVANRKTG